MTARLTRLATGHPRRAIALAGVLFVLAAVLGLPVANMLGSSASYFEDPSSQYERTNLAIRHAIRQNPADEVEVLLSGARPIDSDPAERLAVAHLAALLQARPGFQRISDYAHGGSPALLSRDRTQTVLLAAYGTEKQSIAAIRSVRAAISKPGAAASLAQMRARFGGFALVNEELNERTISGIERAELFGLPILLLLSFWFFRGLIAALLPPVVGGLSIVVAFLLLRIVDAFTPISVFALNLMTGMGLGLGIDYSLFVLSRYREELARGASTAVAIERTLATAGRTVLFSCVTVAAAMTSLLVFPIKFLSSMGIGGALVTLCDGAAALIVLPALLVLLGERVNSLAPRSLQRRAQITAKPVRGGIWWRLASFVTGRPVSVVLVSVIVLLAAASPALKLGFAPPTGLLLPAAAEGKEVEVALARDFDANAGEATEIVLDGSRAESQRLAASAAVAAGRLARVAPPSHLSRRTWLIAVLPAGSPFSDAQQRLLNRLRALAGRYGALVGGATAFFADQKASIASHLPLALAILVVLTACFLFLMTGSLTIPFKALAMNALSVGVGFGLLVWIFQEGNLSGPLGFKPIGGLEESSLVLMLVVAFALATDYEVFVLARVKEAHERGLANRDAIVLGIERTGRIVTAAALLFCVAIGALGSSELFFTKQLGIGAALCVAVDATIVRALLVPSLMTLMGDWNWWAPRGLRALHARLGLSEGEPPVAASPDVAAS
jgi:RND superfamily putative drug exporter